jgi:hypothetical protein
MLTVEGSSQVFTNTLDLKNPYFRYNGQPVVPPGNFHESPTEYYLQTIANMAAQNGTTNGSYTQPAAGTTSGINSTPQTTQGKII